MAAATEEIKQDCKGKIYNQRSSGLCIAAWCRQHQISPFAFYYWQRKLFTKTPSTRSDFTEVEIDKRELKRHIILECQGIRVCLDRHFDPELLKKCLKVLKTC